MFVNRNSVTPSFTACSLGGEEMENLPTQEEAMAGVDELLARVRSRRKLPPAAERRQIRKAAGLSLRDIAAAVGVSHTAVAAWEQGSMPREHEATYARLLDELKRLAA
jgi:DNA-binding transcriptional regulator YiaG